MTSWRDSLSDEAQTDLDGVLSTGIEMALQQLAERGEFAPFALGVEADGGGLLIAADPAELPDEPTGEQIRTHVQARLVEGGAQLRAAGLVSDVSLDDGDALRFELEHREGLALVTLVPYERSAETVTLGDMRAAPGTRVIWP